MHDQFKAVSISYQTAPIEIREKVTLHESGAKALMLRMKEFFGIHDLLVVSTCNRTEIYFSSDKDISLEVVKTLLLEKGITETDKYLPYFALLDEGSLAARHLFEVATGLHSQIVGDMQIPNQVKQAYQWSVDLDMAGPYLHRLLHTLFYANKRVALETSFRDGSASLSYTAAQLAISLKENPKILLIGLGEIGADVFKNLKEEPEVNITLMNRTRQKAEDSAADIFRVADFADIDEEIHRADIVITSINGSEPIITRELVSSHRAGLTFKFFIDLSIPRSVEPNVEEIPGVVLFNLDTIQSKTEEAISKRVTAIPRVNAIIDEVMNDFGDWAKEMEVSPTIHQLKKALENIRQEELSKFVKGISKQEAELLDKVTSSIVQRLMKAPVLGLKAACKRGDAENMISIINDLFDLESQQCKKPS